MTGPGLPTLGLWVPNHWLGGSNVDSVFHTVKVDQISIKNFPADIYITAQIQQQKHKKRCEIRSKLTIKTPEWHHWQCRVFLLLTLSMFLHAGWGIKDQNKLPPCCGSAALTQLNPNFSKKLYQQDPKCTSKYSISYINNNLSYTDNTCNVIIIYIIF